MILVNSKQSSKIARDLGDDQTTNLIELLTSDAPKVAVLSLEPKIELLEQFEATLNQIYDQVDHIFLICTELHKHTSYFIQQYQRPKITYFLNGFVENLQTNLWMMNLDNTISTYNRTRSLLPPLIVNQPKPKKFDILLGQPRLHRTLIYRYINSHNLTDQVIMTYLQGNDALNKQSETGWCWEDNLELPEGDFHASNTRVYYKGQKVKLSQLLPVSIYNQTAYTVVTETNFDNHYSFFTEKIVKPILGQRLFIVFSGRHYLKNLRRLGFKTFSEVIDESYDDVVDFDLRGSMICEQINYLMHQDQQIILDKIKPIVEHNNQVLLETPWRQEFIDNFRNILCNYTSG